MALILISMVTSLAHAQFSNPPSARATWTVGDIQTINFKTEFTTFNIALWQQDLERESATLGPVVFETTNDAATQFEWLVQTYDFNLTRSNVFFFWMFEGDPSLQGNESSPSTTSPYFDISNRAVSSIRIITPTPTSSTLASSTSPNLDTTSESTEGEQQTRDPEHDGGPSIGAKVGIGISASLVVLAGVAGAGYCFRSLRKQQKQIDDLQGRYSQSVIQERPLRKDQPVELA
ncbi:hypothetical protein F5Y13DRAFT_186999 [Hypoxylon sp. FL1857]|nr:hypothetical protein F5Y13DRAFT_186999 [Hypoxylon sp. FL1857]